jgi:hypothetical protein
MKPQFVVRDLEIIAAIMLALGYFDVGIIKLDNREFTLTLRGPAV